MFSKIDVTAVKSRVSAEKTTYEQFNNRRDTANSATRDLLRVSPRVARPWPYISAINLVLTGPVSTEHLQTLTDE